MLALLQRGLKVCFARTSSSNSPGVMARFARRQRIRVDDISVIKLARCFFGRLSLPSKLYPASIAVFRRQWNALLDAMEAPPRQLEHGAAPGTLSGPAATHQYFQDEPISHIQWRATTNFGILHPGSWGPTFLVQFEQSCQTEDHLA